MATTVWARRVGVTVAAAAVLGLGGTVDAQAVEPVSAPASAAADVDYATWQNDVHAVLDQAQPYVEQRIADGSASRDAIVLDIDNTSLETYFHPFPPSPAVQPTLDLVRYAHDQGVAIFFVTARPDFIEAVTEANLQSVGYPITGLYGRSIGDIFGDEGEYKLKKRTEIEAQGYTIIANIGNNDSDFFGGHAERTFELPNYDGELS